MEILKTIKELRAKHNKEIEKFITDCPHTDIAIEDANMGYSRSITIRCKLCELNLAGYTIEGGMSYMSYVRDCVNGHPNDRKDKAQIKELGG